MPFHASVPLMVSYRGTCRKISMAPYRIAVPQIWHTVRYRERYKWMRHLYVKNCTGIILQTTSAFCSSQSPCNSSRTQHCSCPLSSRPFPARMDCTIVTTKASELDFGKYFYLFAHTFFLMLSHQGTCRKHQSVFIPCSTLYDAVFLFVGTMAPLAASMLRRRDGTINRSTFTFVSTDLAFSQPIPSGRFTFIGTRNDALKVAFSVALFRSKVVKNERQKHGNSGNVANTKQSKRGLQNDAKHDKPSTKTQVV